MKLLFLVWMVLFGGGKYVEVQERTVYFVTYTYRLRSEPLKWKANGLTYVYASGETYIEVDNIEELDKVLKRKDIYVIDIEKTIYQKLVFPEVRKS